MSHRFSRVFCVMAGWLCIGPMSAVRGQCDAPAKLVPADLSAGVEFGRGVGVSGARAVVGAYKEPCPTSGTCGAVYVFEWTGAGWVEQQKLRPSPLGHAFLGDSAAINGDVIVGGAPTAGHGTLFVYRWGGVAWGLEAALTGSNPSSGQLGISCSIEGDVIAGGAPLDSQQGMWAGAAYVFRRAGGVWQEEAKLFASDAEIGDQFGISVSVEADRLLVGAHRGDDACPGDADCNSGAAYVFRYEGGSWVEEAKLLASDGARSDGLGFSCALSGDRAVVGAQGADPTGAAYVFRRDSGGWVEEARLVPPGGQSGDQFGFVAMQGDVVLVGAPGDDGACPSDPNCDSGAGYLFRRGPAGWSFDAKLTAPDAQAVDALGWIHAVAVSDRFALLGATLRDEVGVDSGAAYAFPIGDCNANDVPDECEPNGDGDGLIDDCDPCPADGGDNDSDGDGVCVPDDGCPGDSAKVEPGVCGCGVPDADADGDSVSDCVDQCPGADDRVDIDRNGTPDCLVPAVIPAASAWGLALLGLVLLVLAKLTFGRPEQHRAQTNRAR